MLINYVDCKFLIENFIEHLKSYNDIKLEVFPTSTVIYGDFDNVMEVLSSSIKWNVNNKNKAVLKKMRINKVRYNTDLFIN